MMKTVPQFDIPLPPSTAPLQSPMDFLQQPQSKYILTICGELDDDEEEEHFQTVSVEDDHWTTEEIPDRHLCIHSIHYLIHYAHTHAHIRIMHLHCILQHLGSQ